ncbi:hypothetical protein ACFCYH_01130 [Streptomyces sp. NPDC056400]|uniref:hypothetical protein n=1 Tax=Streptomyces sp. NPDC056400 TaxID=3345808 RepID=UPI0035DB5D3B
MMQTPSTTWPPTNRDWRAMIDAYGRLLGWTLIVRDRLTSPERALAMLDEGPASPLLTTCSAFDAVIVAAQLGRDALVQVDRIVDLATVPSIVQEDGSVVFLVRSGTAGVLSSLTGVRVASGSGDRITLPPACGSRWDTWPWSIAAAEPVPLLQGSVLSGALKRAMPISAT